MFNQPPGTRVSTLRPKTPAWLDGLVARLTAQDEKKRPWNGTAAAQAIRQARRKTMSWWALGLTSIGVGLLGGAMFMNAAPASWSGLMAALTPAATFTATAPPTSSPTATASLTPPPTQTPTPSLTPPGGGAGLLAFVSDREQRTP